MPVRKLVLCALSVAVLVGCTSVNFDEYSDEARFNMQVTAFASDSDSAPYESLMFHEPQAGGTGDMPVPTADTGQEEAAGFDDTPAADTAAAQAGGAPLADISVSVSQRMMISTVDIRMESKQYDACARGIYAAIDEAGGYIELSDIAGSLEPDTQKLGGGDYDEGANPRSTYRDGDDRSLFFRIRVPQERLADFVTQLDELGNVLSKQESAEDVTLDYVDTDARIGALRAEQEQLVELIGQSDNIEDIILLQQRLSEVRYQLESYESQMRILQNRITYATVNLSLREVIEYTDLTNVQKLTTWEKMAKGFATTVENIGNFFIHLAIWFVANIIYLLILAAAVVAAVILLRRFLRGRAALADLNTPTAQNDPADPPSPADREAAEVKKKPIAANRLERLKRGLYSLFTPPFRRLDKVVVFLSMFDAFLVAGLLIGTRVYDAIYYYEEFMIPLLFLLAFLAFVAGLLSPLVVVALIVRWLLIPRDGGAMPLRFRSVGTLGFILLHLLYCILYFGGLLLIIG